MTGECRLDEANKRERDREGDVVGCGPYLSRMESLESVKAQMQHVN